MKINAISHTNLMQILDQWHAELWFAIQPQSLFAIFIPESISE